MSRKNSQMYVTPSQFIGWVKDQTRSMNNYFQKNPSTHIVCICDEVHGECALTNTRNGRTSVAKCRPTDTWDSTTGYAVAWAKYNNVPIPKIYKYIPMSELRPGMTLVDLETQSEHEFIGVNALDDNMFTIYYEPSCLPYMGATKEKNKCYYTRKKKNVEYVRVLDN